MSGFKKKLQAFIGLDGYEDDYEDDYNYEEYEEEYYNGVEGDSVSDGKVKDNVVSLRATESAMRIVIHEPKSYDDAPKIVDDLKLSKVGIINFETLDLNVKRQVFDFVNGALYSMEGKIQKVTKDIFIVAPKMVEINGLKDEIKNKVSFPW